MKTELHSHLLRMMAASVLVTVSACGIKDKHKEMLVEQVDVIPSPSPCMDVPSSFTGHSIQTEELASFGYWLYTPENPTENMPLIVYLHGASGRGDNLNFVVADEDFPKYLQENMFEDVRAYVLIPQLPRDLRSWSDISDSLYFLIQNTVQEYSIDAKNISLAGFSLGGTSVWELAVKYSNLFARIAPLAGSAKGVLSQVSVLQNIPVRAYVGADDVVIAPNSARQMIAQLQKAGGDAQITMLENTDHVSVPYVVYHDESIHLVDWLIGTEDAQ